MVALIWKYSKSRLTSSWGLSQWFLNGLGNLEQSQLTESWLILYPVFKKGKSYDPEKFSLSNLIFYYDKLTQLFVQRKWVDRHFWNLVKISILFLTESFWRKCPARSWINTLYDVWAIWPQGVTVNGMTWDWWLVISRLPWGSILWPLFFNVFRNNWDAETQR